jgi:hypothetical protein
MTMRLSVLAFCIAMLAGCATAQLACPSGMAAMKSDLLYFGTNSPRGPVTAQQWTAFLEETVTPRFPDGLSVWPASGQWKSAAGPILREDSYVLNIVHAGSAAEEQAFADLIDAYVGMFSQESVLRVQSDVCANI